ncbi:MAG TPA: hypothetical protein VFI39_06835 [Gemmatimonadales bacterium]|nr:hypothetical protein [Gemmatimonadales bacterium]
MTIRLLLAALLAATPLAAQGGADSMTNAGVVRAAAAVDSVFLVRTLASDSVSAGDWAAYLMARLGVKPIPPDLRLKVGIDSAAIHIFGRIADLPRDARLQLGPLLSFLDTATTIDAWASLTPAGATAVRFRLDSAALGGIGIPEVVLGPVLANVGVRYPMLTRTGRDLFVETPPNGRVELARTGVRLIAPPASTPPHHRTHTR